MRPKPEKPEGWADGPFSFYDERDQSQRERAREYYRELDIYKAGIRDEIVAMLGDSELTVKESIDVLRWAIRRVNDSVGHHSVSKALSDAISRGE